MAEIAAPRPRRLRAPTARDWVAVSSALSIPCVLFLLAAAPRVFFVWHNGFDGLYGQDAYAYYDYARQMYSAFSHAQLPPPFWWPFGYPALLNLSFLLLGVSVRAAQIITLASGSAIAPLTYFLAREAVGARRGRVVGLVAGLILALSGQAVQSSVVIMSDAPALMWAALSAWLLLRYRRTDSFGTLALSGVAMALAVITRWENLGFALVWLAASLAPRFFSPNEQDGSIPLVWAGMNRQLLVALGLVTLVLLPQVVYKGASAAPLAGQSWLEGWSPANFFARSFDNVDGHFDYALPVALFYAQVALHPAYLFPLLTPFLFLGAWLLFRGIRREPDIFVLLVGWVAVMYLFLAGIPYENFRFGLGYLVPVAVLAGIGVAATWERIRMLRLGLGLLVALALAGTALWEPRVLQPVLAEKQDELKQVQWLGAKLPIEAKVYTFALTAALQTYSGLHVADLSEESPQRIAADVKASAPAFLFVDVTNILTQWRGRELEQTFLALRDQVGLHEIDTSDRWTLFRIGAGP